MDALDLKICMHGMPHRRQLKQMMEHATQFPEEYSKVTSVQRKVRPEYLGMSHAMCPLAWYVHALSVLGNTSVH